MIDKDRNKDLSNWRLAFSLCLYFFFFTSTLYSQNTGISCELIVPISNPEEERIISLEHYPRLHVLLTNKQTGPVRLWKDWNSWGYFNLRLSYRDSSGQNILIQRKNPGKWEGDFPDFWTLKPGENIIIEVDFSIGQWEGFPDLYGEKLPAQLQAVYENKPDPLASEFGIWVGRSPSKELQVIFK